MKNKVMLKIYEGLGLKDDMEKAICNELVFDVLTEPHNKTGYTYDRREELRHELYGDMYDSLQEKVLGLAGYWGNDLEGILKSSIGDNEIFEKLFNLLSEQEVISGVCLH